MGIYALLSVYPPKPERGSWRRRTLSVLRSPARRDVGGRSMVLYGHATRLPAGRQGHVFDEERTPEQLKGEDE